MKTKFFTLLLVIVASASVINATSVVMGISSFEVYDGIKILYGKGEGQATPTEEYDDRRIYAKNTITITSTIGNIQQIQFLGVTRADFDFTTNTGTYTSTNGYIWEGNSNTVILTGGSSGQFRFKDGIKIILQESGHTICVVDDLIYDASGDSAIVVGMNNKSSITNVSIPSTIEYNSTFYDVVGIAEGAFYLCKNINGINISDGIKYIEDDAFNSCTNLTSITIPPSITTIGWSFYNCTKLNAVYITNIAAWCKMDLYWDGSPLYYAHNLYLNNQLLTSLTIPTSITKIGNYTLGGCTCLTSVTIPNSVTTIGAEAFSGCTNLTAVTIPNSIITIEFETFANCTSLTSITIPNSVTTIESNAFVNCTSLTSITIPQNVNDISSNAFEGCSKLSTIYWNPINYSISSSENTPFYMIRNSVKSFVFGSKVTNIPAYCCYGMSNLTSIEIPEKVTTIGQNAFANCIYLQNVTIGRGVKTINSNAFDGCTYLIKITSLMPFPPTIDASVFANCGDLSVIECYVPQSSLAFYKKTAVWKEFNLIADDGNANTEPTDIIYLPYSESFISNIGQFTIEDVNLGGLNYIWTWGGANYGMKASAYVNKTNHNSESWLMSPPISLREVSDATLAFQHAVNYGNVSALSVKISTDNGQTWNDLAVPNWPAGTNWTFISTSVSLDQYVGSIIQLAFVYASTTSNCPTWEIKNLTVTGTPEPDDPDKPSALSDTPMQAPSHAIKIIRNGTLYILTPDGTIFNAQGARVK